MTDRIFWKTLRDNLGISDATKTAVQAYKSIGQMLSKQSVSGNQAMNDSDRLFSFLRPTHYGRMCMFFYDPKTKQKLPYYDRYPLIIPIQLNKQGFTGLNLHYIPPQYRALLLDTLHQRVYKDKHLNETRRLQISYSIVKRVAAGRAFEPCVKQYLYSHLRSKIYIVPPEDWNLALFLPTERFAKASKSHVWSESVGIIRGHK